MQTTSSKSQSKLATQPAQSALQPLQRHLRIIWLSWLVYRLLALPIFISIFNPQNPDIVGGIFWQGIWLIPAFVLTPFMVKGKSAYALLIGSMFTLIYLGASGVVLFMRIYENGWSLWWIYSLDMMLLLLINIWLFILLKRLPSMNKSKQS